MTAPAGPRVILHADMDAFYASIEQRDDPRLRGRPVIVGGTSERGVVMAASYEARPFGVHSAMPTVQARKLCPAAVFLRGDMAKYRRVSAEIRCVFESVSPEVEPLSLDEAFIDVTASQRLFGPPLAIGRLLKGRVREAVGLAVSVGIGPGKMIAKLASDVCKPDGLLEVRADAVRAFLEPLPVGRLWGVGPVTQAVLERAGIRTVGGLAATDPARLRRIAGPATEHLLALSRGQDPRAVDPDREARSYGEENTFGADVRSDRVVRDAIIAHAEAVARRLRHDGARGRVVVLKMKLAERLGPGKFRLLTRRATLPEPTDDGKAISDAALLLWERHRPATPIRLVGVATAGIVSGIEEHAWLFADREQDRRTALNAALDRIVTRFGERSVARGGAHVEKDMTSRVKCGVRRDVIGALVLVLALTSLTGCPGRRRPPERPAAKPRATVPVDAAISDVATGGGWQEGAASGLYRVLVRGGGRRDMRSEVVVQWLRWDERREQPVEVTSVRIAEVSRGGIVVTNSRVEEDAGQTVIRLGLVNPITGAAGEARIWPQTVGKYRVKVKWAEEPPPAQ